MSKHAGLVLAIAAAATFTGAHAAPINGQGTWETTLKARDMNGAAVALNSASAAFFYHTTLNITWLADMNQTGETNWYSATAWADSLTTGGFSDWRLPTSIDTGVPGCSPSFDGGTDCGYNVLVEAGGTYSELAHLYYVTLGNLAYCAPGGNTPGACEGPQPGWGMTMY